MCSTWAPETDIQNTEHKTRKHFISSILDAESAEIQTFLTLHRLYSGASNYFLSAAVNVIVLTDKAPELLLRF